MVLVKPADIGLVAQAGPQESDALAASVPRAGYAQAVEAVGQLD
jgi:hypothetical protein